MNPQHLCPFSIINPKRYHFPRTRLHLTPLSGCEKRFLSSEKQHTCTQAAAPEKPQLAHLYLFLRTFSRNPHESDRKRAISLPMTRSRQQEFRGRARRVKASHGPLCAAVGHPPPNCRRPWKNETANAQSIKSLFTDMYFPDSCRIVKHDLSIQFSRICKISFLYKDNTLLFE